VWTKHLFIEPLLWKPGYKPRVSGMNRGRQRTVVQELHLSHMRLNLPNSWTPSFWEEEEAKDVHQENCPNLEWVQWQHLNALHDLFKALHC
jgi:hypothetical protein